MSDRTPKLPREGLTDTRPERESLDREDLAEKTPLPARRGGETVLVVEDDGAVRALLRMSIASRGYIVLEADQGSRAIQLAESRGGPIDLLVTDVMMPGMDGPELAERLASKRPGLKILYLSGYTSEVVRGEGPEVDVHFLQKPFTPAALAAKVREVLDAGR